jgi:primosomal protein N'
MKYAKVAPLARLPRNFTIFDYKVSRGNEVYPGQIVRVPFRNQKLFGIVVATSEKHSLHPRVKIKSIEEIVTPREIISRL